MRRCRCRSNGQQKRTCRYLRTRPMRWLEARNSRKRSGRSPEALTAGGPTLRGWHDLLNVRPKRGELTSGVNLRRHRLANKSPHLLLDELGHSGPRALLPPATWHCRPTAASEVSARQRLLPSRIQKPSRLLHFSRVGGFIVKRITPSRRSKEKAP